MELGGVQRECATGKGGIPGNRAETLSRLGLDSSKILMVNAAFLCI